MDITLVTFPTTTVALLQHRCSPELVNYSAAKFMLWRNASGLPSAMTGKTFGIAWDDPQTTPPEAFRFDICASVEKPVPDNAYGVMNSAIPGGRCAAVRHKGTPETLKECVRTLIHDWLPASGHTPRDYPVFFQFFNFGPESAGQELQTTIYLPLQ